MKRKLFRSTLLVSLLFGAFALGAYAQDGQIVGGYGDISIKSREARSAASVAVTQHNRGIRDKVTLVKILKAEQQVVAGMNYRVCLQIKTRRGVNRTITAVVYQPIRKKMRLTDWEAGGCREI